MGEADVVRAAGGLVLRDDSVLLVHRPKYDDWTFPKGKAKDAESDEECALREVEEETGLRCTIERGLAETRYRDARDRPKVVRYFVMRPVGGAFEPHEEVDEVRWVARGDAARLLSYEHDAELLSRLSSS